MEFAHRSWGRAIGAAVFIPAVYFWVRGRLDKGMKGRVAVYCALVAAQVSYKLKIYKFRGVSGCRVRNSFYTLLGLILTAVFACSVAIIYARFFSR